MRPLLRFYGTVLALSIVFLCSSIPASNAEGGASGGVGNGDVFVGAYYPIPGSGQWAPFEIGLPSDPMDYKLEFKCFDGDTGNIDCLHGDRNRCTAGAGGRLVYWFTRLKESGNQWRLLYPDPSCIYSEEPRNIRDQIEETILSEFQSRPISPGILSMQPSPHTLIGAHTNFYVETGEQVFDFVLFEQDIRIVARPTEYEWKYGDGVVNGPAPFAGGPLPADRWGEETTTSHVYRATGDYQASVVTYFSAEYSINGGPMVPIDGRATVPSAPQTVSVWKSESRNVADDCLVNPDGFGC